jgi:anthranilate phosphoribosyltransferase
MRIHNKISKLLAGETFEVQEAVSLMMAIVEDQEVDDLQIAAIIALIESRGVSSSELRGFRNFLRSQSLRVTLGDVLDVCGTGGDNKDTFNISTLAAFVVAGAGERVAKHGNYAASGITGSSNILEKAGFKFSFDETWLAEQLNKFGFCYLHAPLFQPALAKISGIRKRLGFRTFFNILGPLLNPANPTSQLLGVADSRIFKIYSNYFEEMDLRWLLVHSFDGYDEISLTGQFIIRGANIDEVFFPEDLGLIRCRPQDLASGGTVDEAYKIFMSVLNGTSSAAQREVVVANAAFALYVSKPHHPIEECIKLARNSLDNGLALKVFNQCRNYDSC